MDATDHGAIEHLRIEDAAAGLALSTAAHWNQTEDDWRFFLAQGTVLGIRDTSGTLIATAAVLPYSDGNAWISMVLVAAAWRRRGFATRLLDTCLDITTRERMTTWLDATAAGAAVYGPLGFTPSIQLQRLRFEGTAPASQEVRLLSVGHIDDLIARDRRAMGFDRSRLLGELSRRPGARVVTHESAICLVREGRAARQIGPLYADHGAAAAGLIEGIIRTAPGRYLIDVAADQQQLMDSLHGDGWTIERAFRRMRFGQTRTMGTELPFAGAGPEYG